MTEIDAQAKGERTRARIKATARRLFAEHGVESVSLRDIVRAAGQRNVGAIGYYFDSKDGLIREIVVDGARVIDARRIAMMDRLEKRAAPIALRDVIQVIVQPSIAADEGADGETYIRFLGALERTHRALFLETVTERLDHGYRRAVAHIRRLTPHIPRKAMSQRLMFMMLMLNATLSARESALEPGAAQDARRLWLSPDPVDTLVDAIEGMLTHPPRAR